MKVNLEPKNLPTPYCSINGCYYYNIDGGKCECDQACISGIRYKMYFGAKRHPYPNELKPFEDEENV